jgi:hypothetical protein
MISCRHTICHQCDDDNARAYRELLVDIARELDMLGCNLIDLPQLIKERLIIEYERGFDIGNQP